MLDLGWRSSAACRADPGGHWDGDLLPSMFAMCMACPVRGDCLREALKHESRSDCGVWGGTNVEQRRLIKRGADPRSIWRASKRAFDAGLFV